MLKKVAIVIAIVCMVAITVTLVVRLSVIPVEIDNKYPAFYNIWTRNLTADWYKAAKDDSDTQQSDDPEETAQQAWEDIRDSRQGS